MTGKRLTSFAMSALEIPTVIILMAIVFAALAVLSSQTWWLTVECLLVGSAGMAGGIKLGRSLERRATQWALDRMHREFVLSTAPHMLATLPDDEVLEAHDAPESLREHVRVTREQMQAALREAKEAQAHEHG